MLLCHFDQVPWPCLALQGTRVDEQGHAVLVGVATVPRTSHWPTDLMLRLPAEATAVLRVEFLCS